MNTFAFECVSCSADLPEIKNGSAVCAHCGTTNFISNKAERVLLHSADGEVPVEIPKLLAIALFLRSAGLSVRASGNFVFGDNEGWEKPIPSYEKRLNIAELVPKMTTKTRRKFLFIKEIFETKATRYDLWADIIISEDDVVLVMVTKSDLEKGKLLGEKIENAMGLPAKVYIDSTE